MEPFWYKNTIDNNEEEAGRMTMNYERRRSVNQTRKFLVELLDPNKTPQVSASIRQEARRCLKHYPSEYDMKNAKNKHLACLGISQKMSEFVTLWGVVIPASIAMQAPHIRKENE